MPRKAKEIIEKEKKSTAKKVTSKKATTSKKASTKKTVATAKKATTKGTTTKVKKAPAKKAATTSKKVAAKKTASTAKKTTTKETNAKAKKAPAKKAATAKKTSTKKSTSTAKKKATSRKVKATAVPVEHYDLPYHYNQTVVKVLAQTPKSLFVYWDISDNDRNNLLQRFGENFFNDTLPFLRVINENSGYSFDVDVDDFANGWYVSVPDPKSTYKVLLFRKQRPFRNKIIDNEIYLTSSNDMESPNDHILFETFSSNVLYKNVKNGVVSKKTIPFMLYKKSQNAIYGLYEYYKEMYQNENLEEVFNLNNPSSSNPTSTFR